MIQQLFKQMFAEKRIFLAAAILLFAASFAATAIAIDDECRLAVKTEDGKETLLDCGEISITEIK